MKPQSCIYCMVAPKAVVVQAEKIELVNITHHHAHDGQIKTFKPTKHPNKSNRNLGGRLDKVSNTSFITDFSAEARIAREGLNNVVRSVVTRTGPRKVNK